ncbi:NADP-dependent oxidoreductase [Apibacter adventoris]|uniref:Oxidoreductase n=1 Tax=Apibacter adventoris TaxID=1679466 RepID=A0A2S8AEB2_9FLAO|nr:NADP-dependent oxidoreductase [Apibacter adventoris]PQL93446.1 oxidoreductase [Apibacter adventoris]
MKAIVLKGFGEITNLAQEEISVPQINYQDVLVKVKAFSINPVDVKTRQGGAEVDKFIKQNPIVLGWDVSGEIVAKGQFVNQFEVGDEVFGMINFPGVGNAYAEYVAAPFDQIALKPNNITHYEAAASSMAALTAWQAFNEYGLLRGKETVLIHGASGGVSHYAVQIAKYMDAYVIGTTSTENKDFVYKLGANDVIDYKTQDFEKVLEDIEFILETQGGDNFGKSLNILRSGGTIINLPSNLTEKSKKVAFEKDFKGSLFMAVKSNGSDLGKIAKLLESEIIKSHIYKVFSFNEIQEAHRQMESGHTVGKVVISL